MASAAIPAGSCRGSISTFGALMSNSLLITNYADSMLEPTSLLTSNIGARGRFASASLDRQGGQKG